MAATCLMTVDGGKQGSAPDMLQKFPVIANKFFGTHWPSC